MATNNYYSGFVNCVFQSYYKKSNIKSTNGQQPKVNIQLVVLYLVEKQLDGLNCAVFT